ncbi:MAG: VWA domain-containing protein [Deltaproteobacteria bacterium]|nr:VWA domain-containing protein [Deltaproteobacteria bacterium]
MGFGNAALLFGMVLGLVPIIIHLINRRRARLVRFAAIEFLLMSDKRLARRLKLKQLLVLALRVLLILAIAFALAKPYLEPDGQIASDVSEPGAGVLVVDDSASMLAQGDDGESRLQQALARARQLVGQGGPRTSFAIVAAGAPARVLTPGLSFDHAQATRALDKIDSAPRGADLEGALREAGRLLSESGEQRRVIHVLSDHAAHFWRPPSGPWTWVPVSAVERERLGDGAGLPNLAVLDARVTETGLPDATGTPLTIDAEVANFGAEARQGSLRVELGDQTAAELISLEAGAKATVTFQVRARPGITRGVVRLEAQAGNALALDDALHFTVGERRALTVLVVNGAPRTPAYLDEAFFLRAALGATMQGETPISRSIVGVTELTPARIAVVDVVVLANVGSLTKEQALALTQFVERGGGLLVTAGDKLGVESNAAYEGLLPFPIREVKSVGKADDPRAVLVALSLTEVDFEHPVLSPFDGLQDASLFKARVFSYALLDTVGREGARVLASLTGGVPALVEAPLGRGRVIMWTSSIDRDWADLSLRTSFPPLVQRLVAYLARSLDRPGGPGFVVGQEANVPVPDGMGPLVLIRPDGAEVPLDAVEGAGTVFVGAPDLPGHYAVMRAGERERALAFAVNVDRSESDLGLAGDPIIELVTTAVTRDNGILPSGDAVIAGAALIDSAPAGESEGGRTVIWPWILAGLFLLFAGEAWLLIRN